MKTFDDLIFKPYVNSEVYSECKQAVMDFNNGYGVSVLFGSPFCSDGINTYEVAVLYEGELCYNTHITNYVISNATKEQVSFIMMDVQKLK